MSARKTPPAPEGPSSLWIAVALAVVTLAVYFPVTSFQFVNYDDTDFVTGNPHVQAGLTFEGFKWAWGCEVARNWHPITIFTHMLDCQLFGVKPWWPHLVNALLHAANTVLLFGLFKRMTGAVWRSAAVAALFALHPLHVESVAWVSERKDVLSTLFWFLTTWAYVRYVEEFKVQSSKFKVFYVMSLLFFALGLMSKPMLVTLPCALLLLDYWPLGRKTNGASPWRLAAEKIPFFAMSAALCVVTFVIQQHGGAVQRLQDFPISSRLANALVSYVRYIEKMFWPRHLAGLYLRSGAWPWWVVTLSALLLLAVSVLVLAQRRIRPYLAVGWFWYLGTLVPVIGLVQVGMQSMADRFTYVPMIGLFIMLVWGGWELAGAWCLTRLVPASMALALTTCAALTIHQEFYWKDSETLFKRMIDATPNNYMARYNLGNLYSKQNRTDEAISNYMAAIEGEPNYAEAHNNLGGIYLAQKRYDEALDHYRTAVRVHPEYLYFFNLANALADAASARHDTNEFAEATRTYLQALQLNPASSEAHQNLKRHRQAQGRPSEAMAEFEQAALLESNRVDTWTHLGFLYAEHNRMPEAERAFRELARLQPNNDDVYGLLGNALAEQNKLAEAVPFYLTALKLNSANCQTEFNLGLTFARLGKRDEAAEHYRAALRINPNYAEAQTALRLLQGAGLPPRGRILDICIASPVLFYNVFVMRVVRTVYAMQRQAKSWQARHVPVGFVPTMGSLHEGHLSLVERARREVGRAGQVVVSIYVNPTQFAPHEDLAAYPRDFSRDKKLCAQAGVDVLFAPSDREIYPAGFSTYVAEERLSRSMEGAARPTHFRGVTTVLAKLFHIVQPSVAVFGAKDFQQAAVVRKMVRDLNFPLKIIVSPTVREPGGLALSSRNKYLTSEQRLQAAILRRAIQRAREAVARASVSAASLRAKLQGLIATQSQGWVDYIEFFDPQTLAPVQKVRRGTQIALAVFIGKTRLIDNARL